MVSDSAVFIFIAIVFNYFVVYKKKKVLADIFFVIIGVAMYTVVANNPFGIIVVAGGLIAFVYDLFTLLKS